MRPSIAAYPFYIIDNQKSNKYYISKKTSKDLSLMRPALHTFINGFYENIDIFLRKMVLVFC